MPAQSSVGSSAGYPPPPWWLAWAFAAAAVFVTGFLIVGIAQDAVPPTLPDTGNMGADFGSCISDSQAFVLFRQATETPAQARNELIPPDRILEFMWLCAIELGGRTVENISQNIFQPLMIIMTVWFGVGVMFGGIDAVGMLNFVLRLGFAVLLLENYFYPTLTDSPIGPTRGVPWTIAQQGIDMGRDLTANTLVTLLDTRNLALQAQARQQTGRNVQNMQDPEGESTPQEETDDEETQARGFVARILKELQLAFLNRMESFWTFFLTVIALIVYCQYLWGFVALSVFAILGPMFIPFVILPQMDWLFWGWIRGLVQSTIYMMTSAVMFVVTAMILLVPLEDIRQRQAAVDPEGMIDFVIFVFMATFPYIPIVIAVLIASFKIGGFSGGLISGGGMPGAGLAGVSLPRRLLGGATKSVDRGVAAGKFARDPGYRQKVLSGQRGGFAAAAGMLAGGYMAGRGFGNRLMSLSSLTGRRRRQSAEETLNEYDRRRRGGGGGGRRSRGSSSTGSGGSSSGSGSAGGPRPDRRDPFDNL